jgi:hypothetical protein
MILLNAGELSPESIKVNSIRMKRAPAIPVIILLSILPKMNLAQVYCHAVIKLADLNSIL